jgi:hypothetical protein
MLLLSQGCGAGCLSEAYLMSGVLESVGKIIR